VLHILRETGKSLKIHQDVNQGSNVFEDIDLSKAPKTSRHSTDDFQIDSPFGKLKEKKDKIGIGRKSTLLIPKKMSSTSRTNSFAANPVEDERSKMKEEKKKKRRQKFMV